MSAPTAEQRELIRARIAEYVAAKRETESRRRIPREVYPVSTERLTYIGDGMYVRRTRDGGIEFYELV